MAHQHLVSPSADLETVLRGAELPEPKTEVTVPAGMD